MRYRAIMIVSVLAALALATPASAQSLPNFAGTWSLDMQATLGAVGAPSRRSASPGVAAVVNCYYLGQVTLSQDGSSVGGPAMMTLNDGGGECPAEMTGNISGTVSSDKLGSYLINGSITGSLGAVSFSGTLSSPSMSAFGLMLAAFAQSNGTGGTCDVNQGTFAGTTCSWTASLLAPVPTLTPIALLVLVILLLAAGAFALSRETVTPASS